MRTDSPQVRAVLGGRTLLPGPGAARQKALLTQGSESEGFRGASRGLRWAQLGFAAGPPPLLPRPLPPAPSSQEVPIFQMNELTGQKKLTRQLPAPR